MARAVVSTSSSYPVSYIFLGVTVCYEDGAVFLCSSVNHANGWAFSAFLPTVKPFLDHLMSFMHVMYSMLADVHPATRTIHFISDLGSRSE
eukprot:767827-Hanusia_phi.AAC.2